MRSILARQLPDGGFNIYAEGPSEISATVKAYTALKLAGLAYDDPNLARARERILALGGMQAANSYVKINLSLFNLYPREATPAIPPEMMLLGNLIYEMSSWTRAIVIPLSIVHAMNPQRPVPAGFSLEGVVHARRASGISQQRRILQLAEFLPEARQMPEVVGAARLAGDLRTKAIRRAEQWMLERTRYTDGLGAIYPPMMYVIMALDLLGYPKDHPDVKEARSSSSTCWWTTSGDSSSSLVFPSVWDTAIAAYALGESGVVPEDEAAR